jgi:hypothetical protein
MERTKKQAEREVRAALRELEQAQQDHELHNKAKTDALLAAQLRVEEAQFVMSVLEDID